MRFLRAACLLIVIGYAPALYGAACGSYALNAVTQQLDCVGSSSATGTVTSVSFTGGIISVANPTTTPALTVAGTSGGIVYFSSSSTWASSGVLGANLPIFGGGAGASPIAGTRSGNTTVVVTTTGTQTSGNCVSIDASGNHVANGAACLSSADLAGTYFNLGSTNAVTAVDNTFPSSASKGNIILVAGANDVPTAILAGSLNLDLSGRAGYVGPSADYRVWPYVQGSGRNLPTEPTSGYIPIWLSDFKQTFDADFRFSTDTLFIGTAGTTAGKLQFQNATSGSITLVPVTGALGTITQVIPAFSGTLVVAATSTTATQFLVATTTAGAPAYRAIAAGDLPTTLTSGTAITNAALTTPAIGAATGASLVLSGSLTSNALTATRMVFAGTSGLLSDDSDCTFATDTLTCTKFSTTQLLASGIVDGKAPVDVTTGTTATLGGTYKSGYTINEHATAGTAVAYTLPTAAAGLQYCVGNGYNGSAANTGVITLNTSASGQFMIFTDGTLTATGGNVTSGGAGGDFACVVGVDATHWQFRASQGTWTKH